MSESVTLKVHPMTMGVEVKDLQEKKVIEKLKKLKEELENGKSNG